eukprot:scaffold1928_cov103-Isochrysis_galbana.AAC.6
MLYERVPCRRRRVEGRVTNNDGMRSTPSVYSARGARTIGARREEAWGYFGSGWRVAGSACVAAYVRICICTLWPSRTTVGHREKCSAARCPGLMKIWVRDGKA